MGLVTSIIKRFARASGIVTFGEMTSATLFTEVLDVEEKDSVCTWGTESIPYDRYLIHHSPGGLTITEKRHFDLIVPRLSVTRENSGKYRSVFAGWKLLVDQRDRLHKIRVDDVVIPTPCNVKYTKVFGCVLWFDACGKRYVNQRGMEELLARFVMVMCLGTIAVVMGLIWFEK